MQTIGAAWPILVVLPKIQGVLITYRADLGSSAQSAWHFIHLQGVPDLIFTFKPKIY